MIDLRLADTIRAVFAAPQFDLNDETRLDAIPNWDSLGRVNLIFALEDRFTLQLDDEELARVETVGDLERLLT